VWIGYGIESGSHKVLDLMNKKPSVKQAKRLWKIQELPVFTLTTLIFGYPG